MTIKNVKVFIMRRNRTDLIKKKKKKTECSRRDGEAE